MASAHPMTKVDYDQIASHYNRRYELHAYPGIRATLREVAASIPRSRVLEVGCGTGEWLVELASIGCDVAGIDPSESMLELARTKVRADLRRGAVESLPWSNGSFDLVLCVNALHHFASAIAALREAYRVLRPAGKFLSIGLDPHESGGRWYVYEFFPRSLAIDRERFASKSQRLDWLESAGFRNIRVKVADRLELSASFEEAVRDGVLERAFTSQLAMLSASEYSAGLEQIRQRARDAGFRLYTELALYATYAERLG
jgi:ubiquinone/menaquinone biosynthesis C-methylase UbiE